MNYISSFGYMLFLLYFISKVKTSLHLLKDIELVLFLHKKHGQKSMIIIKVNRYFNMNSDIRRIL